MTPAKLDNRMRSKCLLPLTILLSAGLLSACVPDPATDLRSQTWRVVSSNGAAGQMTFNMSTVAYTSNEFSRGYSYEFDNNELILEIEDAPDTEPHVFELERISGEYILTPETQETRDALGELTLAPTEE